MNKNIFKSIGAGLAGIIVGAILSIGTDKILENIGILPLQNLWVSSYLVLFVLFYRTVYNTIGSYVVARLAPSNPMRHAIAVGILGTLVSVAGAIITKNMNLGPAWYAWALAVLTLPSSWLGGKLYMIYSQKHE